MLNFNHLYYFHIAATEGSVKGASERLGVTQPTVSEQIRMLEKTLGVALFERTSTGLRLTQRGREAYEHTTAMFLAGERLVETLGHLSRPPAVALRVGITSAVSRTVAADLLMPVLLLEKCRPSVRMGEFNELLHDLRAQEIDLLIGESEPLAAARAGLEHERVHRPRLVAIAHPSAEPLKNWENLSLLEYRTASAYHWEVDTFLKENDYRPISAGELDDAFLMLEAVTRGGFVAFVPSSVAKAALQLGKVKVIGEFVPASAGVHALYPSSEANQLARSVVARLIENAKELVENSPPSYVTKR